MVASTFPVADLPQHGPELQYSVSAVPWHPELSHKHVWDISMVLTFEKCTCECELVFLLRELPV